MIELWKLLLLPRHKYKCSIWCPTSRPLRGWKSCANNWLRSTPNRLTKEMDALWESGQFDEGGVSLLKHAAMICELEKILDRPVDIVPEKMLRPRVRESVDQDKMLIYERTR